MNCEHDFRADGLFFTVYGNWPEYDGHVDEQGRGVCVTCRLCGLMTNAPYPGPPGWLPDEPLPDETWMETPIFVGSNKRYRVTFRDGDCVSVEDVPKGTA